MIRSSGLTTINKLGDDLLVEILIRGLPNPRSACSSKLVCKRWSSLISGPRFNRRFVSHGRETNPPMMPDDPLELLRIIRGFLPPMPHGVVDTLRVSDCNKDLVLCGFCDVGKDYEKDERSRSYLVCNPFTKQWIALPLAPRVSSRSYGEQAGLVCEPIISHKLDLGDDDGEAFVYFEYRFRVVRTYIDVYVGSKADVFCSETGEWTKEALFCRGRFTLRPLVSCNEELFWTYYKGHDERKFWVARFNPFRLDMPPASIDPPALFPVKTKWSAYVSQGALHVVALENETLPVRLSVWRLEEDGRSWRKQFERSLSERSKCCNYDVVGGGCHPLGLHPHKPEIAFFRCHAGKDENAILCYDDDSTREVELKVFGELAGLPDGHGLRVFQPRVCCWPTPIPRYRELQGVYDGSYSFWFQTQRAKAKTPPLPPSLINCMDRVMKSAFYKGYIQNVTAEATMQMVAAIIQRRKDEIGDENVYSRHRRPRSPVYNDEWDLMRADLEDVEADITSLGKQKEELKQAILRKTSPKLPYPPPGN
ncbi:unnamed protein product [Linum tenue]|uniref:F-box protein At3g26010-like beta-propeller domain-containing protein n=1 Tax=Linum tenue TaxID=586396 RepID=A0AAV0QPD9_9ROSI|nr:unnamed protein product [Linum tenue]